MEVGVVYAIWSAVGTAFIATIGILWFKEPISVLKIGSLALIILGGYWLAPEWSWALKLFSFRKEL